MINRFCALVLAATLAGCSAPDSPQATPQAQPTVDSDGSLSIPAGYNPGLQVDPARVDCKQYLELNPPDVREEAGRLCSASTTPAERERNPYCQIESITVACTGSSGATTP